MNVCPNDIHKIINDIIVKSDIRRFIIHGRYRELLPKSRKEEIKGLFVNKGCSVYMSDDGWDAPTFSYIVLTANDTNIKNVLELLFETDIKGFSLKDQYITFNTYVTELTKPKMDYRFDFCFNYNSWSDGQSIGMQGGTEIVEPYEIFVKKYLKGKMR